MDVTTPRKVGKSNLRVMPLGFGASPMGDAGFTNAQMIKTVQAAWDSGVRFYDTAPYYGFGRSERRLGMGLCGVTEPGTAPPRDEFRVNTKVGKTLVPEPVRDESEKTWCPGGLVRTVRDPLSGFRLNFDYSGDAIRDQHQDSLQRMGLASVDSLTIHDLDFGNHTPQQIEQYLHELSAGGGSKVLAELRAAGVISAIGCGVSLDHKTPNGVFGSKHEDLLARIADVVDLDFFLIAGPYTLLNTTATRKLFPMCEERGIGVIIGAPYASGLLVRPEDPDVTYLYAPPPENILKRAQGMRAICDRHNVPLAAAAIQFGLAHATVASVIPGARAPEEASQNYELMHTPVPQDVWKSFKEEGFLDPDVPTPDHNDK